MINANDLWEDLAKEITKDLKNPRKLFPYHREDLLKDIESVIKKFVDERIIYVYYVRKPK